MKTLVIHPTDSTTDFLSPIYANLECEVLRDIPEEQSPLPLAILEDYDRILMMGHGYPGGLLDPINWGMIINPKHATVLQQKKIVSIWCNADKYIQEFDLKGIYTGMIISEDSEAQMFIPGKYISADVTESNEKFAIVMQKIVEKYSHLDTITDTIKEDINQLIDKYYHNPANHVINFNRTRIYIN